MTDGIGTFCRTVVRRAIPAMVGGVVAVMAVMPASAAPKAGQVVFAVVTDLNGTYRDISGADAITDIAQGYRRSSAGRSTLFRPLDEDNNGQLWRIRRDGDKEVVHTTGNLGSAQLFQMMEWFRDNARPGADLSVTIAADGG